MSAAWKARRLFAANDGRRWIPTPLGLVSGLGSVDLRETAGLPVLVH